jgi:myo-inositol-1(or 4)-monophosphatase
VTVDQDGVRERHDFAVCLALEAGALAMHMRNTLAPATAKSAIDFCTEADVAVERLIRDRIASRFGDAMIGEEDGGDAAASVWVVDPIDGTTNYIHNTGRWCVSIAYVLHDEIECGVIYSPTDNRLFTARRGAGAFLNGARMEVGTPAAR